MRAEFAETAIFVPKCHITYRNQFFVPELVTGRVCVGDRCYPSLFRTFSFDAGFAVGAFLVTKSNIFHPN